MGALASGTPRPGAILVGIYLFSVPAFGYSDSSGLLAVPQVLGALLVGFAVLDLVGRFRIDIPVEIGLYGLLGVWAVLTFLPLAGTTADDLKSLGTLIKVVVTTLACAQLIKDEDDLFVALKIFVFSSVLVYIMNGGELQMLRATGAVTEQDRFAGTLTNANTAAILSLTVLWTALMLMRRAGFRLWAVALYFPSMAAAGLILYYSGSKKGLIGLALLGLFAGRLLTVREKPTLLQKGVMAVLTLALVASVAYAIYTSPFFFRVEQLFQGMANPSDANRLILAREAIGVWLRDVKTFFLGVGYDQYWKYSTLGSYAHSTPLELLASNGLVGFSLFAAFLVLLWRRFVRLYRKALDPYFKSEYFGVLLFLLFFSFFMLAAVLHESRELMPILGCLAAFGRSRSRLPSSADAGDLAVSEKGS